MKTVIKLLLCLPLLYFHSSAIAQADINNEVFTSKFVQSKNGVDILFNGKSHSFTLTFSGVSYKTAKVINNQNNQNFITIGDNIIQASLIALPQPISPTVKLSKLTSDEIKATLEAYVNYELDYITKDLKVDPANLKKEWKIVNSQLFLIWSYEAKYNAPGVVKQAKGQIYYSTIVFNQVLDINIPLYDKNEKGSKEEAIRNIASSLKSYNQPLVVEKR